MRTLKSPGLTFGSTALVVEPRVRRMTDRHRLQRLSLDNQHPRHQVPRQAGGLAQSDALSYRSNQAAAAVHHPGDLDGY